MQNECVVMDQMPQCELCRKEEAVVDGKTKSGSWAYMCWKCFEKHGVGLGLGKGQELIKEVLK